MPILESTLVAEPASWRERLLLRGGVCLVFVLGLLLTIGLWYAAELSFQRDTQAYFDYRVRQLLESIDKRLENYRQVLYGTRGLFAASEVVERTEFHQYIAALNLVQLYPGIQGVGFSLIVPKEKKDGHIEEIRQQGFPDYQIYPADERDSCTSIIYLEPFTGRNLRAFGYDMFSEPVRHQAMVYARDYDEIGISGKVTLVQETDDDIQAGFLMYLPVYRNGQPHGDEQQRRANIIGWVYAPFRINDFMAGVGGEWAGDLNLSIYDGDQVSEANLMYYDKTELIAEEAISTTQKLVMGGHAWTLVIHSEPGLKNRLNHKPSLIILISGVALSLLLALSVRQFITRGQALALAAVTNQELKESETRFRLMADSAPVLIWVLDANQWAIWFNKHWLDFTGRSLFEEIGRGWLESVYPAHVELVAKLLDWHFQLRKPFSVEYRLRRHDGEYRWIMDTGVPRFDEDGDFMGFIGSCIDITEHKKMEEELWELATTDGLTGLLNRRHFLVCLQEEFDRSQRNAELHSSVLMLDLDHFKRINDGYGHAAGDAVLKHFAEIIHAEQRKIDVVGRLGGEEFAIILPDTGLSEARVFAERLRKAVADKPLQQQDTNIEITVSIGIALLSAATENPDSVLRDADRALYVAKESGRNQVVLSRDCFCDRN
ncbi:MAG: CHASE domain-containing protein [Methylococcaceae bacterium]|nr:CHASE domain-containing protein [Methylococcaceae bacterium]